MESKSTVTGGMLLITLSNGKTEKYHIKEFQQRVKNQAGKYHG